MYAPQLFHGTSGDVTVPESSTARDSIRGASPRLANSRGRSRLGMTIATYWSPAMMFRPMQVAMTDGDQAAGRLGAGDDGPDEPLEEAGVLHDRGEAERRRGPARSW